MKFRPIDDTPEGRQVFEEWLNRRSAEITADKQGDYEIYNQQEAKYWLWFWREFDCYEGLAIYTERTVENPDAAKAAAWCIRQANPSTEKHLKAILLEATRENEIWKQTKGGASIDEALRDLSEKSELSYEYVKKRHYQYEARRRKPWRPLKG